MSDPDFSPKLREIVREIIASMSEIRIHCDRCLKTQRYGGNVVLMVVDASFTSIGLNYFKSIVPKIIEFKKRFSINSLRDLANANIEDLNAIWRNKRSWGVATEIAKYLIQVSEDDRDALRNWAKKSSLENWKKDPIGEIKGVGLITFQYLRMMGGIDTIMPDKIVKRVLSKLLYEAGIETPKDDLKFIKLIERVANYCSCRAIELCWASWFIQYDEEERKKYLQLLYEL